MNINVQQLNELESRIHQTLTHQVKENENLKIIEAAEICEVSSSKVSKLVRKLGFENFKQYKQYLSGKPISEEKRAPSNEFERLKQAIDQFDSRLVDEFLALYSGYQRIVLYGLGPSYLCVQYFAYKLALVSGKHVLVSQEEDHASHLVDEDTLLIVFSVTGKFASFEGFFDKAKANGAEILLILEEYNTLSTLDVDHIFYLTRSRQLEKLLPYEKTRTLFFIFIEEIISALMLERDGQTNE